MLIRGQKLYAIWRDELEIVEFQEESVSHGATLPTWKVRSKNGRTSRCSIGMYELTEKAAWEKELAGEQAGIVHIQKTLKELKVEIANTRIRIKELKAKIKLC
jgi:hypothetical protein